MQAARRALEMVGRTPSTFTWLFIGQEYHAGSVVEGVREVLGDTPLLGLTTPAIVTPDCQSYRSVCAALTGGNGFEAQADLWTGFSTDSLAATRRMVSTLNPGEHAGHSLFLVADGFEGDCDLLAEELPPGNYGIGGALAAGNFRSGNSYQVGGRSVDRGSLAGALLSGDIHAGIGVGHGWSPAGVITRVSQVQGYWVRSLDEQRPSQVFSRYFGYPPREWAYPPLNEMVRLYPLGLELESGMVVRSPLHMEADGSMRMNSLLRDGVNAYLLLGSTDASLRAAENATANALRALQGARPFLALLLVDAAWMHFFASDPGAEARAVQSLLGGDVPVVGAYTYGQIGPEARSRQINGKPHAAFYNQHLEVILLGER